MNAGTRRCAANCSTLPGPFPASRPPRPPSTNGSRVTTTAGPAPAAGMAIPVTLSGPHRSSPSRHSRAHRAFDADRQKSPWWPPPAAGGVTCTCARLAGKRYRGMEWETGAAPGALVAARRRSNEVHHPLAHRDGDWCGPTTAGPRRPRWDSDRTRPCGCRAPTCVTSSRGAWIAGPEPARSAVTIDMLTPSTSSRSRTVVRDGYLGLGGHKVLLDPPLQGQPSPSV